MNIELTAQNTRVLGKKILAKFIDSPTDIWIVMGGALVIAVVVGLLVWRITKGREKASVYTSFDQVM